MSNQVQIPLVQTQDNNLNQIQQNVNKVLRNIYNQLTDVQIMTMQMEIVGEIKYANLTLDQFQDAAGSDWVLCDGGSCIGTSYALLTGNNTVPNIAGPPNAFIKVN